MNTANFDGIVITCAKQLYHKTTSGTRYKTKPANTIIETLTPEQYVNCCKPWFRGDRIERAYTYAGYIPTKVTTYSPDGYGKWVFSFSFERVNRNAD